MRELKFIQEVWKKCPGFEDSYEVSNLGTVRSIDRIQAKRRGIIKGKIISYNLNQKGYPQLRFYKNNIKYVRNPHRLVAIAFIPNPNNLPQVNHIDGNKKNNRVDNLEWVSNSCNQKHAYRLGLQPSRAGENNSKTVLTDNQVSAMKIYYNSGKTLLEVSNKFNVSIGIVRNIFYLRTWKTNKTPILKRDDRSKTKKPILCEI